jgi:hypothetical protein
LDEMETRVYTSDYAFQSEVSDLSEWFVFLFGACEMEGVCEMVEEGWREVKKMR